MATTTARELIRQSLQKLGLLASGENPSGDEITDGLLSLNQLLEKWSLEPLMLRGLQTIEFTLVPGQSQYEWYSGIDADINLEPNSLQIQSVHLIDTTSNPSQPLTLPITVFTDEQFESIAVKNVQSTYPQYMRYNPTYPTSTIDLYPVPTVANKIRMRVYGTLTGFANANASAYLPPGYMRALVYSLAVEIAADYGKEPSALVMAGAMNSRDVIKRANSRARLMPLDLGLAQGSRQGRYNILSDS